MKIYAGSDHAGFAFRGKVVEHLRSRGHDVEDLGAPSAEPSDYPDWAAVVGRAVRGNPGSLGVLLCGSGLGVCVAANKIRGVRAVNAWNAESAGLARAHNDANVLCVGARFVPEAEIFPTVDAFVAATFEGGRHARRVAKIAALEAEEFLPQPKGTKN